jgi:hypothetical protein
MPVPEIVAQAFLPVLFLGATNLNSREKFLNQCWAVPRIPLKSRPVAFHTMQVFGLAVESTGVKIPRLRKKESATDTESEIASSHLRDVGYCNG